jgi:hypothetical protein
MVNLHEINIKLYTVFTVGCVYVTFSVRSCLSCVFSISYGNCRRKSTHSNAFVKYVDPTPRKT